MKLPAILFGISFSFICFAQESKAPTSAAEFCENMGKFASKEKQHKHGNMGVRTGYSVRNLRIALGLLKVQFGPFAKNATPHLQGQGFENLLEKQPKLLSDAGNIPDGAIFVLDKAQSPDCPVNAMSGHVAVKCGSNELLWQPGVKDLSAFIAENPKCIKSVMYNPKWSIAKKHSGEPSDNPAATK